MLVLLAVLEFPKNYFLDQTLIEPNLVQLVELLQNEVLL